MYYFILNLLLSIVFVLLPIMVGGYLFIRTNLNEEFREIFDRGKKNALIFTGVFYLLSILAVYIITTDSSLSVIETGYIFRFGFWAALFSCFGNFYILELNSRKDRFLAFLPGCLLAGLCLLLGLPVWMTT